MSTHKHIDRICVVITVLALLITILFMNGEALGLEASSRTMGYEKTLFDTSRVHTIDIIIDDWDAFLATATTEEYTNFSLVIDNEAVKNVAIRGKGNTSLSTVATMGSSRYSFKIEFDHYQTGKTYKGLDKLCLNNLIQDNTYMKDYLAYRLMDEFGVDTPLCSYVYVTVNGEDWGLYLAVEAVEDSFMERVYNGEGDLYKPDSLSMGGGGPGNGMDFNIEDFINENAEAMGFPWGNNEENSEDAGTAETPAPAQTDNAETLPQPSDTANEASSGDEASSAGGGNEASSAGGDNNEASSAGGDEASSAGGDSEASSGAPDGAEAPEGMEPPEGMQMPGDMGGSPFGGGFGGFGGGMGMGSSDVKLQYTDDDPDSYSNIFGNAKSTVTEEDQARLISALKTLSEGENLEEVLDIDELLRYFVVHNYLVNSDSYTGSMIHNYYLREADGQFSMIPWDYNLAFGTFQGSDASAAVNDPIDSPLSVAGDGSRPMVDWIFQNEEYTELYHQYFAEFLDEVDIAAMIDEAYALIAPYVEKDPTAFCTYEEFEAGVDALRSFCEKRTESVRGQLDGTIPSTDAGQQADSSALVDASDLSLSDLGTMGGGAGGGFGGFGGGDSNEASSGGDNGGEASSGGDNGEVDTGGDTDEASSAGDNSEASSAGGNDEASSAGDNNEASSAGDNGEASSGEAPDESAMPGPDAAPTETQPADSESTPPPRSDSGDASSDRPAAPDGFSFGDMSGGFPFGDTSGTPFAGESQSAEIPWTTLIITAAVLVVGFLTAILYKRRRH